MPFSQGTFITAENLWSGQFRLLIEGPPFLFQLFLDPDTQTAMDKTRPSLDFLCYVSQWSLARLLSSLLAKSLRGSFLPATGAIGFRERSPTRCTAKASFVHDQ